MNCTTLLATIKSHNLPYLDISQTQQPCFELSKDLNTIYAYGTTLWLKERMNIFSFPQAFPKVYKNEVSKGTMLGEFCHLKSQNWKKESVIHFMQVSSW